MAKTNIKQLMDNYLGETATPEQRAEAHRFAGYLGRQADLEGTLRQLKAQYQEELNISPRQVKMRRRRLIMAAASATVVIGCAILFKSTYRSSSPVVYASAAAIFAGNLQAELRLANGQVIPLNNSHTGTIYNKDGISVDNSADGKVSLMVSDHAGNNLQKGMNELFVPKGGRYTLTLPDGSAVTLDADSKLRFPALSNSPNRTVYLQGMAFFDVAKDPQRPFRVVGSTLSTEVLGTSFSISNFSGEPVTTTVLTGKIKITTQDTSHPQEFVLNPNQQAVYISGKVISVSPVNAFEETSWKEGRYELNGEPLTLALVKIGRWFNVGIDTTQVKVNKPVYASFRKTKSLDSVLANISKITNIQMEYKQNKIIVK